MLNKSNALSNSTSINYINRAYQFSATASVNIKPRFCNWNLLQEKNAAKTSFDWYFDLNIIHYAFVQNIGSTTRLYCLFPFITIPAAKSGLNLKPSPSVAKSRVYFICQLWIKKLTGIFHSNFNSLLSQSCFEIQNKVPSKNHSLKRKSIW